MKRKEFIKIVTDAMEVVETNREEFSCLAVRFAQKGRPKTVEYDYRKVFGYKDPFGYRIPICFGYSVFSPGPAKKARLNALAMYLAQSLVFKTYKEL